MKKILWGVIIGALGAVMVYMMSQAVLKSSDQEKTTNRPIVVSPMAEELDQMFSAAYPDDAPGASVIIAKNGKVILKKGYGLAVLEHNIAITPQMTFRIGSLTKQFTAVAILLLEQESRLKTSDFIQKYLPDYPTHGEVITIAHLLGHTSGIPNYTNDPDFIHTLRNDVSVDELIDTFKDKPLDFKPGEKWNYSNSGYVLLGAIIEKASGQSYAEFITERIFKPLGMRHSHYGSNTEIIFQRARGYDLTGDGVMHSTYISMSIPYAAGSLLASSEDLLKWHNGLLSGSILPRERLERAWTSGVLNNSEPTGYGFGWGVGAEQGHKVYQHSGGIPGFNSYIISMPDDDVLVVVLSNLPGAADVGGLAQKSAALVVGIPVKHKKPVTLPVDTLNNFLGDYLTNAGDIRTLAIKDGMLISTRRGHESVIKAVSETSFFFADAPQASVYFEKNVNGNIAAMVIKPWGQQSITEVRQ